MKLENVISKEVTDLFHLIRIAGNKAVHNKSTTNTNEALTLLQTAQQLGIWFHRTFSDRNFKSKAFIPPSDTTTQRNAELKAKIEELEKIITDTQIANQHPTTKQTAAIIERGEAASKTIDLNEDQTRALIDQQLRDRGWEVDSENLRYSQGFRPTKGKLTNLIKNNRSPLTSLLSPHKRSSLLKILSQICQIRYIRYESTNQKTNK